MIYYTTFSRDGVFSYDGLFTIGFSYTTLSRDGRFSFFFGVDGATLLYTTINHPKYCFSYSSNIYY